MNVLSFYFRCLLSGDSFRLAYIKTRLLWIVSRDMKRFLKQVRKGKRNA